MPVLGQCSVCGAQLTAPDVAATSDGGAVLRAPPRLFFAGREHHFCRGTPCLMTFKRDPERFAAAGRPPPPGDGPPRAAPPRTPRGPSPFTVRAAPSASGERPAD